MTTFVLTQQRIMRQRMAITSEAVASWFFFTNRRGFLSIVLGVILFLLVFGYMASTIQTIRLGIAIQEADAEVKEFSAETRELETLLQREMKQITGGRNVFLTSMEEVSRVRYLVPESVAASRSVKSPQ